MKTRIVFLYIEDSSIIELAPLKRLLEDLFQGPPPYHVPIREAADFLKENGEFQFVFFHDSIDKNVIKQFVDMYTNTTFIKGLTLEDEEVATFISSQ
jgi:hypothetical protein